MMQTNSVRLDKVPPQNVEAERSVLGAMMMEKESQRAVVAAIEILGEKPDAFYREAHQKIYTAILNLFERGIPSDLLTVVQELERTSDLEKVGGVSYLDEMIDSVPTAVNVAYYADMVKQEYRRRKLILLTAQVYNEAFDDSEDVDALLERAESQVFGIMSDQGKPTAIPLKRSIKESFNHVQEMYQKGENILGLSTGYYDLDKLTSGFQNGDYIVIAGRPGMGKSMFAMNIAEHVSMDQKGTVLMFSMETSHTFLTLRMLSSQSGIEFQRLKTGKLDESDWPKLTIVAGVLSEAKMFVDDTPGLTMLELRARAKKLHAEKGLDMIVVDYLQLMTSNEKFENRQVEVSRQSSAFKRLAHELKIPVVVLAQLSRNPERRTGNRPQLSDLRESGAIEQDADLVLFLYRDHYYDPTAAEDTAEVIVGKQRHGPTGVVELLFDGAKMRFRNLSRRQKAW